MLKLVYGCLAFSLISGAFIFVSAATDGPGFRGMTKSMSDAIVQDAAVLTADRNGAITQTGNGHITGYTRDLTKQWSKSFDPFEEGPNNPYGAGTIKSFAWCTDGCPNAILDINREFTNHGGASAQLAATLTDLGLNDKSVLSIYAKDSAFVATESKTPGQLQLRSLVNDQITDLPVQSPLTAAVDSVAPPARAIIGSARGNTGFLTGLTGPKEWKRESPQIRQVDLRNACISEDGQSIGLIGSRVKRARFMADPGVGFGPAISGGVCTVDAGGITSVYTPATNTRLLEAARYDVDGKRVWHQTLGTQRLLSRSGWRLLVAQDSNNKVTAIDAVSGRTVFSETLSGRPFAAQDGSIVAAGRDGKPRWLVVGKPLGDQ